MPERWNGGYTPERSLRWGSDRYPTTAYDDDRAARYGRHALDEDALHTPIFHALAHAWRRGRVQREQARPHAEWDAFRRDPLTAPIPVQAYPPVRPAPPRSPALPSRPPALPGRHRLLTYYRGGR